MRFIRTWGIFTLACLLALVFSPLAVTEANASSSGVVISAIYTRGGSTGATYTNKFVEIFNAGTSSVDITGWTVRYASPTGLSWSGTTVSGSFSLQAGQRYLFQWNSNGASGIALPTPDASSGTASGGPGGKIGLFSSTAVCAVADPTGCTGFVDYIGYGTATNFEGTVGPAPAVTEMAARKNGGCTDSDNNGVNFELVAANPRNSASTLAPCVSAPALVLTSAESADPILTSQTVTYTFNSRNTGSAVTDALLTVDFTGSASVTPDTGCTMSDADTMTCALGALTSTVVPKTAVVTPSGAGTVTANGTLSATSATNATSGQSTTVNAPAPAALTLTMTDAPDPVLVNNAVQYTITLTNTGGLPATNPTLSLTFSGTAYPNAYSAISGAATCINAGINNPLICNPDSLASGASMVVVLSVTPTIAGTVTLTGAAGADGGLTANDSESTTVDLTGTPVLNLTATDSPDPVVINNPVTYTFTAVNTGNAAATSSVLVVDFVGTAYPAAFTGANEAGCATTDADTLTCTIGTLAASGTFSADVIVTPTVSGLVSYTATVTADGSITDTASGNTTVNTTPADVSVNITESVATVDSNLTVDMTFVVSNASGVSTATSVVLAGSFSGAVTGYTFQTGGGSCIANTLTTFTCNYASIAAGASRSVVVRVNPEVNVAGESQLLTSNATVSATAPETGGNNTDSETTSILAVCGDAAHKIYAFQENGASFNAGGTRVFEGVVTADFQFVSPNGLGGFYMQEVTGDANVTTSDGIWVALTDTAFNVVIGEKIRLTGTPGETFAQTGITATSNQFRCGAGFTVAATPITLPMPLATREQYEGMLITLTSSGVALTVNEAYQLNDYGEIQVGVGRRYQPTSVVEPGALAIAAAAANAEALLLVDDGRDGTPPAGAVPHIGTDGLTAFRIGSTIPSVTGVLGYGFSKYRLQPTVATTWTLDPRPTSVPSVGGRVQVASFNVLNFFNGDGVGGGFPTSRGATTLIEYNRQRTKLVIALDGLNADVVGLMEIENDSGANQALESLITELNAYDNANGNNNTWAFVDTGMVGTDAIKVALIYDSSVVALEGVFDTLNNVAPFNVNTRPPLAQTFRELANDQTFTVVVNHFKSKGSCGTGAEADQGDGQGCWNPTRVVAANALLNWFAGSIVTNSFGVADTQNIIVMGDLNSYAQEDPIDALKAGGFFNLIQDYHGLTAYGYIFSAVSGYLDYVMVNGALKPYVTGVEDWHINSSEPDGRDYNDNISSSGSDFINQAEFYQVNQFRTSDHDPVLMGFTTPGTSGVLTASTTVAEGGSISVTVTDPDWSRSTISVTITTPAGDSEIMNLAVTGTPGVYTGSILTVADAGAAVVGNGTLETNAVSGTPDSATVTYTDPFDINGLTTILTASTSITNGGGGSGGGSGTAGTLTTTTNIIPGGDLLTITVVDPDLTTSATVVVTTPGGEQETLSIIGSGGTYTVNIDTGVGPAIANNATVEAVDGETITFSYLDQANGAGGQTTVTDTTTVIAINAPSAFTLITPVADTVILTSEAAATFTWNEAADDNSYTLFVFKLSNSARVGVTLQVGVEADEVCISGICSYTANPSDFQTGTYAWSVVADGIGSADVEASNSGIVFAVNNGEIELVINGGFETAGSTVKRPANWIGKRLTNDKRTCTDKGNGSLCALSFTGGIPANPLFKQVLDFTPYALVGGEAISLSADIFSSKPTPGTVVVLTIIYVSPTDGVNGNGKDKFILAPVGSTPNVYATYAVSGVVDGAVKKSDVRVQYRQTGGKLRVDNVSVTLTGDVTPRGAALPFPSAPEGFRGNQ